MLIARRSIELGVKLTQGIFASDLHLFSSRSDPSFDLSCLFHFSDPSDCIVLGGDIFDFKWSCFGTVESTTQHALRWLDDLLEKSGESTILYLSGNHDCLPTFERALDKYASENSRFEWYQHALQLGECLFLHGDILDAQGSAEVDLQRYRSSFHHPRSRHKSLHRVYDLAVEFRLHNAVAHFIRRQITTCKQLSDIIRQYASRDSQSLRSVYFGHTHVPIHGVELDGMQFFNPGAMLRYANYYPREFSIHPGSIRVRSSAQL